MHYYVYILSNSNKSVLYTGMTNDLVLRVYEHKNHLDKGSFTSSVEAAIEREKQIKSWNRKKKNKLIQSKILIGWIYTKVFYKISLKCWGIATPVCGLVRNDSIILKPLIVTQEIIYV